jgi:hypothetical protein
MSNVALRGVDDRVGFPAKGRASAAAVETAPATSSAGCHDLPATKSTKASILRNPIQRMRKRRQQTEKQKCSSFEKPISLSPSEDERVGFEEVKIETAEVRLLPRGKGRGGAGAPCLEIVLEDNGEPLFYDPPDFVGGSDRGCFSPGSSRCMALDDDSPSTLPLSHRHKPAGRSIMKGCDVDNDNCHAATRLARKGRKHVSFDESTILRRQEKKKSVIDNIALAMPAILPYLVAILILILSAMVPPDPSVSGRIKKPFPPLPLPPSLMGSQSAPSHVATTPSSPPPHAPAKWNPILGDESRRQGLLEGPPHERTDDRSRENKPQLGDDFTDTVATKRNPLVRAWRAVRRIGEKTSS